MRFIFATILVFTALSFPVAPSVFGVEKWFFAYVDLLRNEVPADDATNYTTSQLIGLLPSLQDEGYSVIVLSSFQLADDELTDPASDSEEARKVQQNLMAIRDAVVCRNMSIIPEVMPVGASQSVLQNDKNLAEGTPVRGMLFQVGRNEKQKLEANPIVASVVPDGTFREGLDVAADAWRFDRDSPAYSIALEGPSASSTSLKIQFGQNLASDFTLNARHEDANGIPSSWHNLKPWHQYQLSFAVRTRGLTTPDKDLDFFAEVTGRLDDNSNPTLYPLERVGDFVASTQEWTQYHTILNSYEFTEAQLWFGSNLITGGTAWITDIRLQEIGGANLIRRCDLAATPNQDESLPVKIRLADTNVELVEDTDFAFWRDVHFNDTEWFRHDHPGMPIRILRDDLEGKTLAVDYYHATIPDRKANNVCCSVRHPEVMNLFRRQVARLNFVLHPTRWLINHDEIRAFAHDPLAKGDSPGKILRENLKECKAIINAVNQHASIIVFNDMYDPHHNALPQDAVDKKKKVASYYPMINGEFDGSWCGMDSDITILNWQTASNPMNEDNLATWRQSINHFNTIVHVRQVISGFYDVVEPESVALRSKKIFKTSVHSGVGPVAVCYYTTNRNTKFIADFSMAADQILGP